MKNGNLISKRSVVRYKTMVEDIETVDDVIRFCDTVTAFFYLNFNENTNFCLFDSNTLTDDAAVELNRSLDKCKSILVENGYDCIDFFEMNCPRNEACRIIE